MPITKATQNVITPNIVTTDSFQIISSEKEIKSLYVTTSTTSLTISTGSKTLVVGTGLSWKPTKSVIIRNASSSTRRMDGTVTSYNSTTGEMVVNITSTGSASGQTFASWNVFEGTATAIPILKITSNDAVDALSVVGSISCSETYKGASQTLTGSVSYIQTSFQGIKYHRFAKAFANPNDSAVVDLRTILSYGGIYKVYVKAEVVVNNTTAGTTNTYYGGYEGAANIVQVDNASVVSSFTVNGVTTAVNFTTAMGSVQTQGGVPTGGFATLQGTASSGSTDGNLNLTIRGHTTADSATFYSSVIYVILMEIA